MRDGVKMSRGMRAALRQLHRVALAQMEFDRRWRLVEAALRRVGREDRRLQALVRRLGPAKEE